MVNEEPQADVTAVKIEMEEALAIAYDERIETLRAKAEATPELDPALKKKMIATGGKIYDAAVDLHVGLEHDNFGSVKHLIGVLEADLRNLREALDDL